MSKKSKSETASAAPTLGPGQKKFTVKFTINKANRQEMVFATDKAQAVELLKKKHGIAMRLVEVIEAAV